MSIFTDAFIHKVEFNCKNRFDSIIISKASLRVFQIKDQ